MFSEPSQSFGRLKWAASFSQKLGLALLVVLGGEIGLARADEHRSIHLNSPNGGESFLVGQSYTITWSSSGLSGYVNLELRKAGIIYALIGFADVSAGRFDWRLCDHLHPSSDYTVHITPIDGPTSVQDSSDAPFNVLSSVPPIRASILAPHADEVVMAGSTYQIRWSSLNPIGDVAIYLSKSGVMFDMIGVADMASGQFDWDLCASVGNGGDYSIQVVSLEDMSCNSPVFETSQAFAIVGSSSPPAQTQLTLTSPAPGQVVHNGTTVPIRWTATNPTGNVDIYVLKFTNLWMAPSKKLGSAPMAGGRFDWIIDACEDLSTAESYQYIYLRYACGQQSTATGGAVMFQAVGLTDGDGDGTCDRGDNCPSIANADQADCDQDGTGDGCDSTPGYTRWYRDEDGDGYGAPELSQDTCQQPQGFVARAGDCVDQDPTIHPGVTEICDGKDNDCDGVLDNAGCPQPVVRAWFRDQDIDGHGDANYRVDAAEAPPGYAPLGDDCDDLDATIHPGAVETCGDNRDNNCNGQFDEASACCTSQLCGSCVVGALAVSFAGIAGMKRKVRRLPIRRD